MDLFVCWVRLWLWNLSEKLLLGCVIRTVLFPPRRQFVQSIKSESADSRLELDSRSMELNNDPICSSYNIFFNSLFYKLFIETETMNSKYIDFQTSLYLGIWIKSYFLLARVSIRFPHFRMSLTLSWFPCF